MNFRFATTDDAPRLIEMSVRFILTTRYAGLFSVEQTPAAVAGLVAQVLEYGAILVAEVDSGVRKPGVCVDIDGNEWHAPGSCEVCSPILVGMLALVLAPHPLTGRKYAEEIAWWVEPEYRKGRVGPYMLRLAEDWATKEGANMVKMVAPAGSSVGAFYEKTGYEAVETAYVKTLIACKDGG